MNRKVLQPLFSFVEHCTAAKLSKTLSITWKRARTLHLFVKNRNSGYKKKAEQHSVKIRRDTVRTLACRRTRVNGRVSVPFPSAPSIANEIAKRGGKRVSRWTIWRDTRKRQLTNFVRPKVPCKRAKVILCRRNFCNKWRRAPLCLRRRIGFSDEHTICCNDYSYRRMYACNRKNVVSRERMRKHNVARANVWACISTNYKSPLLFFDDTMTAVKYVRNILSKVVPALVKRRIIFQQDGARPHVSKSVHAYLSRKGVLRDGMESWPPYSPDLNVIEQLWAELDRRISDKAPQTQEQLRSAAQEAWSEIPMRTINNYVRSFGTKCSRVFAAGGEA